MEEIITENGEKVTTEIMTDEGPEIVVDTISSEKPSKGFVALITGGLVAGAIGVAMFIKHRNKKKLEDPEYLDEDDEYFDVDEVLKEESDETETNQVEDESKESSNKK